MLSKREMHSRRLKITARGAPQTMGHCNVSRIRADSPQTGSPQIKRSALPNFSPLWLCQQAKRYQQAEGGFTARQTLSQFWVGGEAGRYFSQPAFRSPFVGAEFSYSGATC